MQTYYNQNLSNLNGKYIGILIDCMTKIT
jgi:hypothetical protein